VSEPKSRAARRAATARRILDAARAEFGERGFTATTIRRIAQRANVDPSLVMQHYGSKAALFAVAIDLGDAAPGEVETHLHDVLDVRLADLPPETKALVRSMLTTPEAAEQMSAFLNERVANLSRAMDGDDADLRAALIVSSILGLTIGRHFLKLDAFGGARDADIARVARPWITTGVEPAGDPGPHSASPPRPAELRRRYRRTMTCQAVALTRTGSRRADINHPPDHLGWRLARRRRRLPVRMQLEQEQHVGGPAS
jgi:AcrR family transcriptional regulator